MILIEVIKLIVDINRTFHWFRNLKRIQLLKLLKTDKLRDKHEINQNPIWFPTVRIEIVLTVNLLLQVLLVSLFLINVRGSLRYSGGRHSWS